MGGEGGTDRTRILLEVECGRQLYHLGPDRKLETLYITFFVIWSKGWKFTITKKQLCLRFKNFRILTVKGAAVYKNYHLRK